MEAEDVSHDTKILEVLSRSCTIALRFDVFYGFHDFMVFSFSKQGFETWNRCATLRNLTDLSHE